MKKWMLAAAATMTPLLVHAAGAPAAAPALTGKVLEVQAVQSYTYLRLKTKDGETWAAVGKSAVKPGTEVTIDDPMYLRNFESRMLKRRFDKIVFGTLHGGPATADGHGAHAAVEPAANAGDVKVAKASGRDARTVAEVVEQRAALKNRSVLIRAKVVKFTPDVLKKNWLHVRDGSGSDAQSTNDLVVTTLDRANVGDVVLVKGVVHTERNLGSGYAYPVLLEDATLQRQ